MGLYSFYGGFSCLIFKSAFLSDITKTRETTKDFYETNE